MNEFIFSTDFYVLDMGDDNSLNSSSILLGRPFLKTTRTKIDGFNGTLSMKFNSEVIKFNIYATMWYPSDISTLTFIDVIKHLTDEYFEITNRDLLILVFHKNININATKELSEKFIVDKEV